MQRYRSRAPGAMVALLLTLALAACGDNGNTPADGGPADGRGEDRRTGPCPPPEEGGEGTPAQVINEVAVAPADVGFDLNGDTLVDNQLSVLSLANEQLALALEEGRLIQLVEVRPLEDPPNGVEVFLHEGEDVDGEPCNNLGGQGRFRIVPRAGKKGAAPFRAVGTVMGDQLTVVTNDSLTFSDNELTVTLRLPRVYARVNADGTLRDGIIGGVVQSCDLSRIDPQLGTGKNALETLLGLGTLPGEDFDADGLETFELDDDGLLARCIDADGTAVEGRECACDPLMADGYSVALTFATTSAFIESK